MIAGGLGVPLRLTKREWLVLSLAIQRKNSREIGEILGIHVSLVKRDASRMMRKMRAVNFKHVVALAVRGGDLYFFEDLRDPNDIYREAMSKSYLRKGALNAKKEKG